MYRSNASILSILFTGVALLFYITYSSIGKIETNQAYQLYTVSPGVDFGDGILNAPTFTGNTSYQQSDIAIPDYSPQNTNYEASSVASIESRYANRSSNSSSTYSNKENTSNSNNASSMSGAIFASNGRSSSSDASKTVSTGQMENVSSLTTDGSLNSSTTRQSASRNGNNFGGTDPGGDPTGPPIPIGNGTWTMIALAIMYALWKSNFNYKKCKQQLSSIFKYCKLMGN